MAITSGELRLRLREVEARRSVETVRGNLELRRRLAEEKQISRRIANPAVRSFVYLVRGLQVSRQLKANYPQLHNGNLSLLSQWVKAHGAGDAMKAADVLISNPDLLEASGTRKSGLDAAKAVVRSLAETGDARFLDFIARHGLTHHDPAVRVATLQSLGEMGNKAKPLLTDIVDAAERDKNPFVRQIARNTHKQITGRKPRELTRPRIR